MMYIYVHRFSSLKKNHKIHLKTISKWMSDIISSTYSRETGVITFFIS